MENFTKESWTIIKELKKKRKTEKKMKIGLLHKMLEKLEYQFAKALREYYQRNLKKLETLFRRKFMRDFTTMKV